MSDEPKKTEEPWQRWQKVTWTIMGLSAAYILAFRPAALLCMAIDQSGRGWPWMVFMAVYSPVLLIAKLTGSTVLLEWLS
jgi:hypothetical protein